MIRFGASVRAVAALAALSSPALAQDYPTKPITLVVPYTAGGPSDTIGRLIGESMSKMLGQHIVIENVTGAGGTLGAAQAASAEADGYTLLLHHVALAATASLYKDLGYDPAAFEPIGLVNYGPFVVTSRADFPAESAEALFAKIKEDGDQITMAHAGDGSGSHLCGLMLTQALGTQVTYVPYQGTGPAMTDLVGKQVDVLCDQTTNAVPQIEGKAIKAYAVTSADRIDTLDLPTVGEVLESDFEVIVWHAFYAPEGAPAEVIQKLHEALQTALADEAIQARFEQLGTLLFPEDRRSPEALREQLDGELTHWAEVIKAAGIEPQ